MFETTTTHDFMLRFDDVAILRSQIEGVSSADTDEGQLMVYIINRPEKDAYLIDATMDEFLVLWKGAPDA